MRGAHCQSRHAALDERKVDEFSQRLLQWCCRVVTCPVPPQWVMRAEHSERIGFEESRNTTEHGGPIGRRVGQPRPGPKRPNLFAPHSAPEFLQSIETILRLV